jgi:hypothetical protein
MTRRDRHIRLVENFGLDSQATRYRRQHLVARRGLAAFTDEAICEFAMIGSACPRIASKTRMCRSSPIVGNTGAGALDR